jgi:uncharacterized protein YciI
MKIFVVLVNYIVPLEQIKEVLEEHRDYLQSGYDRGWLLFSGPQVPWDGGIAICRAPSLQDIQDFFNDDPYAHKKVATFTYMQMTPSKWQPWIKEWIDGK